MILYDQSYNFIGMSNETLSYLGYEDLSDFSSQHSDFANLLVNQEGYVYKFQNFSWIDFILYSGSSNKSALLQLKHGEPLEIKLSVKEVHLLNELGTNSKFYLVRIISDNFVNIAAKTDTNITKQSPLQNAFNLNDASTSSTLNQSPVPDIKTNDIEETDDFTLNFPTSENSSACQEPVILDFTKTKEDNLTLETKTFATLKPQSKEVEEKEFSEESLEKNDFSLNFLKEDSMPKIDEVENHGNDIVKEDIKLDFLKQTDTNKDETPKEDISSGFKLQHLQVNEEDIPQAKESREQEEKKEEKITLNFLTEESATQEEQNSVEIKPTPVQEEIEAPKGGINLNFLTEDNATQEDQNSVEIKPIPVQEEIEAPKGGINLNFLTEDNATQEEQNSVEIKPTPVQEEIEAPKGGINLNFLTEDNDVVHEPTESFVKKEKIIAQIQNDIKEIDEVETEKIVTVQEPQKETIPNKEIDTYLFNKNEVKKEKQSFTKTLKSLFAETSTLPADEEDMARISEPEETLTQNDEASISTEITLDEGRFPALSTLGLEKEEENDLISEFVSDTKANIKLFQDFYKSGNLDQTEYTLIKMQSSANILNLNDIIITLANVKRSCINKDTESIEQLTTTLEQQINILESHLKSATV